MNEEMKISEIWKTSKALDVDFEVSYRLIKINFPDEIYLLYISLGDENTVIVAGRKEKEARNLAELFAREDVTPCTANNIYADMLNK